MDQGRPDEGRAHRRLPSRHGGVLGVLPAALRRARRQGAEPGARGARRPRGARPPRGRHHPEHRPPAPQGRLAARSSRSTARSRPRAARPAARATRSTRSTSSSTTTASRPAAAAWARSSPTSSSSASCCRSTRSRAPRRSAPRADLLICIGSSLEVHPVAGAPGADAGGRRRGSRSSPGAPTPYDAEAAVRLDGDVVEDLERGARRARAVSLPRRRSRLRQRRAAPRHGDPLDPGRGEALRAARARVHATSTSSRSSALGGGRRPAPRRPARTSPAGGRDHGGARRAGHGRGAGRRRADDRGAASWSRRSRAAGVPLALVSNSPPEFVRAVLGPSGLEDAFELLVTPFDGFPPKPAPDLYLEASRRLGSSPTEMVVLEDSRPGVGGALAAGARVIGVPSVPGRRARGLRGPRELALGPRGLGGARPAAAVAALEGRRDGEHHAEQDPHAGRPRRSSGGRSGRSPRRRRRGRASTPA